jgi:4-hydroxy-tetrahydrodipicolinate reductase
MFGKSISEAKNLNFDQIKKFGRCGECLRQKNEIGFSSIRGGSIFGENEVMFINNDECISIKHSAFNRKIFADGAVEYAIKLFQKQQKNGFFTIKDLI